MLYDNVILEIDRAVVSYTFQRVLFYLLFWVLNEEEGQIKIHQTLGRASKN